MSHTPLYPTPASTGAVLKSSQIKNANDHEEMLDDITKLSSELRNLLFFSAEISVSLLSVIVTFCGIVLLSVSLFVSWKLCWLPWRDKEGGGLSLTSGLLPGSAGVGGLGGGSSLLPPLMQRKEGHSSSSLYPSLGQHHPHFSDLVGLERGEVGGVVGGPHETQENSYLDMDSYPNNAGERGSKILIPD